MRNFKEEYLKGGKRVEKYPDKSEYEGEVKEGVREGIGMMVYSN